MKKVFIETLGCQMNKSDSERIYGILSNFGYDQAENVEESDLAIVNTCSIRKLSEEKAFSRIGMWKARKKKNPDFKIGFCGCVAQQEGENIFKRAPYVDLIFGTHNIYELPDLIKKIENGEKICATGEIPFPEKEFEIKRAKSVNAWIPIIEGCNNFCTYCIVPYTRGRERSRSMQKIINEAKLAIKDGFKEITLLGQNVDSYGKDLKDGKTTLANLLRELNEIEGKFRIRFVTSYPTDITDDLIHAVRECEKVCEYFHIPMQSGNNEILKAMNRRYTREQYAEIVQKIRSEFKNVTITSDFIAGFPGETEEQFYDTLSAIDEFQLDYSNSALYSPRPKTVACKWIDKFIDDETKKQRLDILNEKIREASLNSNKRFVGRTLEVLVEQKTSEGLSARAENNKIVHFKGDYNIGDFVNVNITDASLWCLKGEIN